MMLAKLPILIIALSCLTKINDASSDKGSLRDSLALSYHRRMVKIRAERSAGDGALTVEDFVLAQRIGIRMSEGNSHVDDDAISKSGKYEGDIDLRGLPIEAYVDRVIDDSPYKKNVAFDPQHNAIRDRYTRWSNAEIPYRMSGGFSKYERSIIAAAVADYNRYTCIKWVPRSSQRDYVNIVSGEGCYSSVGKTGRTQELSLGRGCVTKGVVIHEMMHAVGFFHEQSRNDRDEYVDIQWDNVYNWAHGNFKKLSLRQIDHLGTRYDYGSVMHYGKRYFSRNGRDTIITRNRAAIGNRRGFSSNDIRKVNLLYGCPSDPVPKATPRPRPKPGSSRKPRPPTGRHCSDINQHCDFWRRRGECSGNKEYMLLYCRQSCNACGRAAACIDQDSMCKTWAGLGGCQLSLVSRDCPMSCNRCSSRRDATTNSQYAGSRRRIRAVVPFWLSKVHSSNVSSRDTERLQ